MGVLSSIAGIGVLNLAAAHYRDMLSAVPQAELIDAVGAVFSKGFALTTLPALALLLFGYSLAAFAAYKGYYFDDPSLALAPSLVNTKTRRRFRRRRRWISAPP